MSRSALRRRVLALAVVVTVAAVPSCGWHGANSLPLPGTEGRGASSSLALPVADPDLEGRLRTRMDEVEKALYGHVQSRFPFVTETASSMSSTPAGFSCADSPRRAR